MSREAFARSPDLQRLRAEGYAVRLHTSPTGALFLVLDDVPYVTPSAVVARSRLVTTVDFSTGRASTPADHTVHLTGETPSDEHGHPLPLLVAAVGDQLGVVDLPVTHYLSNKLPDQPQFADHHEKFTHYVGLLERHAQVLEPDATARTFRPVAEEDADSPFEYADSATSRAGTEGLVRLLALPRVAIVGLGGTGSHVLDLLAKTPVGELHLFDGDVFLSHNAFRAPGAASLDDLRAQPRKVDYFAAKYGVLKRKIVAHPYALDAGNADELADMDFVFLCLEGGRVKRALVEALELHGRSFVDVGMGLTRTVDGLMGSLQTVLSTPARRDHLRARVSLADAPDDDMYSQNIQIVELNALNAVLAVVRYKKLLGFYRDEVQEHYTAYRLDSNSLINDEASKDEE